MNNLIDKIICTFLYLRLLWNFCYQQISNLLCDLIKKINLDLKADIFKIILTNTSDDGIILKVMDVLAIIKKRY